MSDILKPRIIIDPTSSNNLIPVNQLIDEFKLVKEYNPRLIQDQVTGKLSEVVFTHPVFKFKKEERISKKTKAKKPEGTYYVVFNPESIGSGAYGAAYPILGVWKRNNDQWIYKSKTQDIKKERLVKTNLYFSKSNLDSIVTSYSKEYKMGQWIEHMGYNYPVIRYGETALLISRKQQGISLESLIKKLKDDPNLYSVRDRLTITINLLTELEHQINGIKIPPKNNTVKENYVAHCDIKPSNIIVDGDLKVNFIDYGLAKRNGPIEYPRGTPLYIDPLIYSWEKKYVDKVSDLSSLFRTIAELWGDTSGSTLPDDSDGNDALSKRNHDNKLVDLFKGIDDLDLQEQIEIETIILTGTSYYEFNRVPREQALLLFQKILRIRSLKETFELQNLLLADLKNIPEDKFYFILKSPRAIEFLLNHKNNASKLKVALPQLELKLFNLDEQVLRTIGDGFIDFSDPGFLCGMLDNPDFTANHLRTLIRLGARVSDEILETWLDKWIGHLQETRWVSISRELFKHHPNPSKLVEDILDKKSFAYLYATRFILQKNASLDDNTNIRLLKRHMEVSKKNEAKLNNIKGLLMRSIPTSPFAKAMINELESRIQSDTLQLVVEDDFDTIYTQLSTFTNSLKMLYLFPITPGMPERNRIINSLTLQVSTLLKTEKKEHLKSVLNFIPTLDAQCQVFDKMDSLVNNTLAFCPANILDSLRTELDGLYVATEANVEKLKVSSPEFCKTLLLVKHINVTRDNMLHLGNPFQANVVLEQDFESILSKLQIRHPQHYQNRLHQLLEVYSLCYKLSNTISSSVVSASELSKWTYFILRDIEDKAALIYSKPEVGLFMQQLLNKTLAELENKHPEFKKKQESKSKSSLENVKFFSIKEKEEPVFKGGRNVGNRNYHKVH